VGEDENITRLHILEKIIVRKDDDKLEYLNEKEIPGTFDGVLTTTSGKIAIIARYASAHSLWIDLNREIDCDVIETLELYVGKNVVEIGPCLAFHETGISAETIRIIPCTKILDLNHLFSQSKTEYMDINLNNLSLLSGYKSGIQPEFRDFVSEITNVFISKYS
jgi:hypothetical protein